MTSPHISLITAYDQTRLIGANGELPWHLPNDFKYFKANTLQKPIVMGRATYDSIKKALPNRHNIVLSRDPNFSLPDADCVTTVEQAITLAGKVPEIMIVGGAQIYQLFLPLATRLYITLVDAHLSGDTYFPKWNEEDWHVVSREHHEPDDKHHYAYDFVVFERTEKRA